ncbi:MAG: dienelactone hydrolase family protein [Tepidisphaeraceae bacterium]
MSFLWYWPAGGWDFDVWKRRRTWEPVSSAQSGKPEPLSLIAPGATRGDWESSAKTWRGVSNQILGTLTDQPPKEMRWEWLGPTYHTDKYDLRRLRYTLTDSEWGYAWLLLPKQPIAKNAAVIAHHQTSCSGKSEPIGLDYVSDERAGVYYAREMAERGFTVLAPDAIAFGERQSGHRNTRYHSADEFFAAHPHGSVMGKMAYDSSRAVDLLQKLPETQAKKIGCVGHSHGAYGTLFAMVADERITAGVMSCGVSLLRDDSAPDRWWRKTSLIPRLGYYEGKIDHTPIDFHHWLALCAPRPVFVIGGTQDTIFPNQAALPKRIEMVREVYGLYDAKHALESDVFDGPHSFRDPARERAYAMLEKALA